MSGGVSVVIPALGDVQLLELALGSLSRALAARGAADEILVVDDSGENLLAAWLMEHFPAVRCIANGENLGFARALSVGVQAARHARIFAMNSDVRVRAGFLEPLEAALDAAGVFAVVPRILLFGEAQRIESLVGVRLEDSVARGVQRVLEIPAGQPRPPGLGARDAAVPFPIGGAFLFRRAVFQELGGFDRSFEPFYLEDMDLGWRAWKAGMECRYVAASVVEHHHRGTIGEVVPEAVVLAAIERNRLLFTWKHLDEPALLEAHVRALARRIVEAQLDGERAFLAALCLALEDRPSPERTGVAPSWRRILDACDRENSA